MSTLYEITGQYLDLLEMLEEADPVEEQIIKDTLEGMEGELEEKADNYAKIIKELTADAKKYAEEKKRLEERQTSLENRAKYLKDHLYQSMQLTGNVKFKTGLFSFAIQNNGGVKPIELAPDKEIPEEYTKKEPDNDKIRKALEEGKVLGFAILKERGQHLRIR